MVEKRKVQGRPPGTGAKQRKVMELIAQGVEGREACAKAGYDDPDRAWSRMQRSGIAAEASGADAVAALRTIAQVSKDVSAKIAAISALADHAPNDAAKRSDAIITVADARRYAGKLPSDLRVYRLPGELDAALMAFYALCAETPASEEAGEWSPVAELQRIIIAQRDKDSEIVRTCRLLLQKFMPPTDGPRSVFLLPANDAIPVKHLLEQHGVLWLTAARDSDAIAEFWRAVQPRIEQSQKVVA